MLIGINMKKIAIVTYSLRMGGVESVIFNLGKSFINKGFEVEIIETLEAGVWKNYFVQNNFKVVSIVKKPFITAISHVKQIANYLNKFDIVLLNDAPFAQSILGLLRPDTLIFPILHMSLRSMAFNASGNKGQWNKIIAVSPLLKDFLLNQDNDLINNDIVCILNGINTKEFISAKKTSLQKKRILYLGRISEEKGVCLLPEIINLIKHNIYFDYLDVYGSGPLEGELISGIEKFNLQSKIILKGSIDHEIVSKIISDYDILIMPSFKEGHPIVLLESMSCGVVPVVSLLDGSTNIVVEHGINGYLCEKGNIKEFKQFLDLALENIQLPVMAEQAIKTVQTKFSIELMSNNYIKLFNNFTGVKTIRTNKIDKLLLGDLPYLPYMMVRPVRKILRLLKLWPKN
jgi:glycosyltransferase involved in cell wall biosynthesis